MNLAERKKKYAAKTEPEGLRFNFSLDMMNNFCSYALSSNKSVHRSALTQLKTIMDSLNESVFNGDQSLIERRNICSAILTAKLEKRIFERNMILQDVYGVIGDRYTVDPNNFNELSNAEVEWTEQSISNCINMMFINNNVYKLQSACMDYMNCDPAQKEEYSAKIQQMSRDMNTEFRRNAIDTEDENDTFVLSNLREGVHDVIERCKRPSFKLATGIQALNDILAGGFEGSRVYCFFALPGEGKTTTLINLLKQIKLANRNYVCKDPTKKPCIILLTMENKTLEVISTLFSTVCTDGCIQDYSEDDALRIMMSRGLGVTPDNPIEIIIKYKPINSVDTNYLYKLTEDYEDEGYEVIGLIQDYIKRIRPINGNNMDERFRLGNVINEFRNFACYKDIPVITASQLNREAARIIDESRSSNKNDLVRKLGRANIGESSLIDENLDATIFLTPEWPSEDQKFMGVKLTKHRYPIATNATSFYIPYDHNSEVKLKMDLGGKRVTLSSLANNSNETIMKNFGKTIKYSTELPIPTEESDEDNIENLIKGGTVYSGGEPKKEIKQESFFEKHRAQNTAPKRENKTVAMTLVDPATYRKPVMKLV